MSEIHIHRVHGLGEAAALRLAEDWQVQAERDWGLRCTARTDTGVHHIAFERPGVQGVLRVSGDAFDLRLTLGFLLSAYRGPIESELLRRLDGWLAAGGVQA